MDAIPHSYLFTAYYDDNKEYQQGFDDRSLKLPDERSAFYDIVTDPWKPLERLWAFCLRAVDGFEVPEGRPRAIAVNLRDGSFEIDGIVFAQHMDQLWDYRPIYARITRQHRDIKYKTATGEPIGKPKDYAESAGYVIGWQANDAKGKNVEKVIMFYLV